MSIVEDALTDEEQAMINMLKMIGCTITWEQFADGIFEVKLYEPDRDWYKIKTRASNIHDAVQSTFEKWNGWHNNV